MSKYIDKLNLPQYKYFNNMLGRHDERTNLIADALAGEQLLEQGDKKSRGEAFALLSKTKRRLPEFLFCQKEDQERCQRDLAAKDIRQLGRRIDRYLNILLMLSFYQGQSINREIYITEDLQSSMPVSQLARKYKYDKKSGRYYLPYISVPKLLLINEELYQECSLMELTERAKEDLEQLLSKDVHYIINVQSNSQSERCYLAENNDGIKIQILDRHNGTKVIPLEELLLEQNEVTAVFLCLREYLLEMELAERQRRKYNQEHPARETPEKKTEIYPRYTDENAIKIFDIKDSDGVTGYAGGLFYLRKGVGSDKRRVGYEMTPHTRKGHYRTYKNGKTVYVQSSIIHKEKYEGIQSAHRMNQMGDFEEPEQEKTRTNSFTLGMSM